MSDDTKPETFRNDRGGDHSHIKGWGIDADPANDPTYPMKRRTDEEVEGYSWERPEQQPVNVEVLHSIERPNVTAVFGSSLPPSGLSGALRREAFKFSESSYGHWLPLVLADRVGEIEGIIDDLKKGHIPNIFAEKGLQSEWKYNRKNFVLKSAVIAVAVAGAMLYLTRDRKD